MAYAESPFLIEGNSMIKDNIFVSELKYFGVSIFPIEH